MSQQPISDDEQIALPSSTRGRMRKRTRFFDEIHPPASIELRSRVPFTDRAPALETEAAGLSPVRTASDSFGRYRIFADASSPADFVPSPKDYGSAIDALMADSQQSYLSTLLSPFRSLSDLLWTLHFFSSGKYTKAHHERGIAIMQRPDFHAADLTLPMDRVSLPPE